METLFESPRFVISYDEANGWLHLLWQGHHNETESKAYGQKIVEKVRLTGATRVLNDATLDQDGWGELTRWIALDFMGQLAEAGIVAAAWVLPENLKARADVLRVLAQVSCPLIDTFVDVEAAYNWLKTGAVIANPGC
ncbi:hypothetical protein [Hymenobacter actinosclerus]|uniref:SpoIIAA-like n=1 Tax=Hymenobacter actinosclerus TaxID=82805 RepID=A0A1I0I5L7_9BACT|nr:hypothetical protein [Hymenobacter actinosclerus]SET91908.1 hypothetical protein SAMN04487998_3157 [Hymenobacter actinosclerus]